jgi:hypothetical protein
MALYPEVFKKAQEEVDIVIGQDRLPCVMDRELLPYVNALTLEILRWCVSAPTGLSLRYLSYVPEFKRSSRSPSQILER